tara:strand:- start:927 stop:2012 length:1086 start_codon:yes stop_codon:yes gene_type:complete
MDTSASDIYFNSKGVCNFCIEYDDELSSIVFEDQDSKNKRLNTLINKIKKNGEGKPYDCIVGVSGGVDSSWALVSAKRIGLRPLAVHMDNGWNSELAQNNIKNLVTKLEVDLFTYVIDWDEYRKLMQAFFDSDVIDVELLYDNAMLSVNYTQASKYGLKYILAGYNKATEGMRMPLGWNWFKYDKKNIYSIAKIKGNIRIKTFPSFGTLDYIRYKYLEGISMEHFLDYLPYSKAKALEVLKKDFSYKPYPYKHYESVFTRFYQGYILPNKFSVDKRKLHLSTLIKSDQMDRGECLEILNNIPYPSDDDLNKDIIFFIKKMNWTHNELEKYISRPEKPHDYYDSEKDFFLKIVKIYQMINKK